MELSENDGVLDDGFHDMRRQSRMNVQLPHPNKPSTTALAGRC